MDRSDLRRNALALALVLTAANFAASVGLLVESHKLREQAAACFSKAAALPEPPRVGDKA